MRSFRSFQSNKRKYFIPQLSYFNVSFCLGVKHSSFFFLYCISLKLAKTNFWKMRIVFEVWTRGEFENRTECLKSTSSFNLYSEFERMHLTVISASPDICGHRLRKKMFRMMFLKLCVVFFLPSTGHGRTVG